MESSIIYFVDGTSRTFSELIKLFCDQCHNMSGKKILCAWCAEGPKKACQKALDHLHPGKRVAKKTKQDPRMGNR